MIESVPGRGGVIKAFGPRDVKEMLQVLAALETTAARMACRCASDQQIAGPRAVHDEMIRLYNSGDRLEYYKRNQAIHSGIAKLSGNGFLASRHEAIQSRLKRIRFVGNTAPEKCRGAVAEHEAIIAALEARDEDALVRSLTEHMDQTWERVRNALQLSLGAGAV